jgi:prephenate dehydrogenase
MAPKCLSILGVGLLGGSMGLAVKADGSAGKVVGYGHRASTLEEALRLGAIDRAEARPADAVRGADLVVLCTPVGLFESLLTEIAQTLQPGAIVTDVGSTKRSVVALAERILPRGVHFVGSHPMAGSEKRGVQHASADLFHGAVCITTPTSKTDPSAVEQIEAFWRRLGMTTTRLSPDEHDRLLADMSHLPHALAAALVTMQEEASLPLAGKGFRDATRIAAGDGGLWRDILLDNRDNLRASAERLRQQLQELLDRLDACDADGVKAWLDAAAARRQGMRGGPH